MKLPMKNNSSFTNKNCDGKFVYVISNENNDGIKKIQSAQLTCQITNRIANKNSINDFKLN